ncbi:hypothetical protein PFISCL1PPCAC_8559, partial [Pristionchus fissidentatus]
RMAHFIKKLLSFFRNKKQDKKKEAAGQESAKGELVFVADGRAECRRVFGVCPMDGKLHAVETIRRNLKRLATPMAKVAMFNYGSISVETVIVLVDKTRWPTPIKLKEKAMIDKVEKNESVKISVITPLELFANTGTVTEKKVRVVKMDEEQYAKLNRNILPRCNHSAAVM